MSDKKNHTEIHVGVNEKAEGLAASYAKLQQDAVQFLDSYQLNDAQVALLVQTVKSDNEAGALFHGLLLEAERALGDRPNPIKRIQREGKLDKDPIKMATDASLRDMQKVHALAVTWLVTKDKVYLTKAQEFILAWAKRNRSRGNPIDDTILEPIIAIYDLIKINLSAPNRAIINGWLDEVANAEMEWTTNYLNWNSHRLKVVGLIGFATKNHRYIRFAEEEYCRQVERNLYPDGSSRDFLDRDALHYHCYTLEPLLALTIAARLNGLDWFSYVSPSGSSVRKSVEFLLPYVSGEKSHVEFVNSRVDFDRVRSAAGQETFRSGRIFNPEQAISVFQSYYFFDQGILPLLGEISGNGASRYPTWEVLVESIQVKNLPPAIALGPSVGYEKQAAIQAIKAGIPNTGPVDGPSPGLVSVIIPVKDTQRYLRTCLNSVLGQSHALLDVIAVDDGSRDGSLGILKEFAARDSRIRVLTQDNLGPGAARNIGVASAIGQWICFVDSDDYLHPRYVERLLKAAQECDADVSFCCAVVFDDSNGKTIDSASTFHSIVFPVSFDGNGFDAASYPHKNDLFSINLGPWAKLLNAKLARTIKFPENVRRFEDNPFSYGALFKAQHVAWIREQLYYHRQRKESTMGRVRNGELPAATLEDFMEVRRLCLELFSRDPELASLYERRSSDELWSFFLKLPRELRIEYAEKVRQALGREASRLFGSNRQALRIASYFAPYGLVILGHRLVDSLRATRGN